LKVLFIGMGWFEEQKGGLNRYLYDMIYSIKDKVDDYRVVYYAKQSYDKKHRNFFGNFFTRCFNARRVTKEICKELSPDIINIHFALYAFFSLDILKKYSLVMNFQGPWASEGFVEKSSIKGKMVFYIKKFIEQKVYNKCNKFIVLSYEFKNILIHDYSIDEEKIIVLPPTLDMDKFSILEKSAKLYEKYDIDTSKFVLFTARRLVKRTGVDLLIDALKLCDGSNVVLYIAGKGYYENYLKERVVEYGLTKNVKFLGFVSDDELPVYYNLADLTVMPTVALEGFGLTTIESLACGTPVIGTPSSANNEVIGQFRKELVAKDTSSASLAILLRTIILDPSVLPNQNECRKHVLEKYTPEIFANNILNVFEEASKL
jgi:glycosyltransferase involved in cell wall biosynthesis